MQADAALSVIPRLESELKKLPSAEASWPWLDVIVGGGVSLAPAVDRQQQAMLKLELTQMAQRQWTVDDAIDDVDRPAEQISAVARRRYLEAALDSGNPSQPLRELLESLLGRTAAPSAAPAPAAEPPAASAPIKRKVKEPPMPSRRLRVYALDPSIAKRFDSVPVNETTLCVPWDDVTMDEASKQPRQSTKRRTVTRHPLRPGPVGEYLEVVDVDPASNKVYDPVDLNDKDLLAQDGWPPSEGNPQFHQQMVYAVAMTTIRNFELTLGRKALWAPRVVEDPEAGRHTTKCHVFASIRTLCARPTPITVRKRRRCCSDIFPLLPIPQVRLHRAPWCLLAFRATHRSRNVACLA
jgi:hypothetical protein